MYLSSALLLSSFASGGSALLGSISTGAAAVSGSEGKWTLSVTMKGANSLAVHAGLFSILTWLLLRLYTWILKKCSDDTKLEYTSSSQTPHIEGFPRSFVLGNFFTNARRRRRTKETDDSSVLFSSPSPKNMGQIRESKMETPSSSPLLPTAPKAKQFYNSFLIVDIEATCELGSDFNFPNEIIEFPVCLLRWKDKAEDGTASILEIVDEFRSFVKPTWRPTLSAFCKELTGITQEQVDSAPIFSQVINDVKQFMFKHDLLDPVTEIRRERFCWCCDGPFDIRDFVVKQCFISQIKVPEWIRGDFLDVRRAVLNSPRLQRSMPIVPKMEKSSLRSLNISAQLEALGLPAFEGRQHSGIDDARNIAKIVTELARQGIALQSNSVVHLNRRWKWMGKNGRILDVHRS